MVRLFFWRASGRHLFVVCRTAACLVWHRAGFERNGGVERVIGSECGRSDATNCIASPAFGTDDEDSRVGRGISADRGRFGLPCSVRKLTNWTARVLDLPRIFGGVRSAQEDFSYLHVRRCVSWSYAGCAGMDRGAGKVRN